MNQMNQEDDLIPLQKEVLAYVRDHPGQTSEEIAENFAHSDEGYQAIARVIILCQVRLNNVTRAIYPLEV